MRIKLDENLPSDLARVLSDLGHTVDTVPEEGLAGAPDSEVLRTARNDDRFLITQDLDFSDIRRFRPGTHPGLLLLRLRFPGWKAILQRLGSLFRTEDVEAWATCFVVVTESKVRIRRPR